MGGKNTKSYLKTLKNKSKQIREGSKNLSNVYRSEIPGVFLCSWLLPLRSGYKNPRGIRLSCGHRTRIREPVIGKCNRKSHFFFLFPPRLAFPQEQAKVARLQ